MHFHSFFLYFKLTILWICHEHTYYRIWVRWKILHKYSLYNGALVVCRSNKKFINNGTWGYSIMLAFLQRVLRLTHRRAMLRRSRWGCPGRPGAWRGLSGDPTQRQGVTSCHAALTDNNYRLHSSCLIDQLHFVITLTARRFLPWLIPRSTQTWFLKNIS